MNLRIVLQSVFFTVILGCGLFLPKCRPDGKNMQSPEEQEYKMLRLDMVSRQIRGRGITDEKVLQAMSEVPRHEFIPESHRIEAYDDHPVPLMKGQTISQPYIVALMTARLDLKGHEKVLEIGTGTGYQAAVLGKIVREVYSIEIVPELHYEAQKIIGRLEIANVFLKRGDGYLGWKEHAPFDAILLTAAPDHIPPELFNQLKEGGSMILPVGDVIQELVLVKKENGKMVKKILDQVRFVPMTGEAQKK